MKRAFRTTLIMALVAAVSASAAAICYPWPESVELGEQVGQQLFAEFNSDLIREVEIVKFDSDEKRIEQILLKKDRKGWYIPSAANYPLGNTARISSVLDTLGESKVLEVMSDDQETHQLYGVIDPTTTDLESQTGVGSKLTVSDNNDRPIAGLIIGAQVGDQENQRFVRIEGQPSVYVIQFDPEILSTHVSDWVNHNLLNLATQTNESGSQPTQIEIENYVIDAKQIEAKKYDKKHNYRAVFKPVETQGWRLSKLSKADDDGALTDVKNVASKLNQDQLKALFEALVDVPFSNVSKKPKAAAEVLSSDDKKTEKKLVAMSKQGFRFVESEEDGFEFDSSNGQLIVTLNNNVRITISFGKLAGADQKNAGNITYFAMLTADVDFSLFPEVEKPGDEADEDEQKRFERAVKRRQDEIKAKQKLADNYNQQMADWYFIVGEDVLAALRPDLDSLIGKKSN